MSDHEQSDPGSATSMGRRTVVVGMCVATAGLAVAASGCGGHSSDGPALGSIVAGATVERWTVVAVHPVTLGALPIVLETVSGHRYQVDVLARDPQGPAGVAETEHFSLYVSNRGDGSSPTDEDQGLGAMALAGALREHERVADSLPSLLTLRQRNEQHPQGSFGVPLT